MITDVFRLTLPILLFSFGIAHGADWPQWRGPNRDGVWSETGIVDRFTEEQLEPAWRASLANGYTGPTVSQGRVYVMDRVTDPKQVERIQCFDQQTGASLWSYTYDATYRNVGYGAGPRASVTIHEGWAYTLGSMGHIHCLDAAEGRVLWSRNLFDAYSIDLPIWGIAAAHSSTMTSSFSRSAERPMRASSPSTGQPGKNGGERSPTRRRMPPLSSRSRPDTPS